MSSAIPWATLAITLAVAGASIKISAILARATCSTLNSKFRSKVSTRHLLPVRLSKVTGVINSVAFLVIITCTLALSFFKLLAKLAIL